MSRLSRSGLTLVEVLASLVIISIGSVFILQALAKAAHTLTVAENRFLAYAFSASKFAELEVAKAEGLDLPGEEGSFREKGTTFDWFWEVAPSPEEGPFLGEMRLSVTWKKGRHRYEKTTETLWKLPAETERP